MNKILKKLLLIVNLLLFVVFMLSIFVPSHKKKVMYSNTDVNGTTDRNSIDTVGLITDKRNITLSFELYNQEFYGICLYFEAEGEDESGEITCTLQFEDQIVAEERIQVKELFARMKSSSLSATEIFAGSRENKPGKYTVLLEGTGISPETKISLYANDNAWKYVRLESDTYQEYYGPLYLLEVIGEEHPHIWSTAFILTLSLLFSYIIYANDKEKRSEAIQNNEEI